MKMTFNIIDTPGLFERRNKHEETRNEEEITKVITDCLKYEITKIHCVIFLFGYNTQINRTDISAVKYFLKKFPAFVDKSYLVISRCESVSDVVFNPWYKEMIEGDELFRYYYTNKKNIKNRLYR